MRKIVLTIAILTMIMACQEKKGFDDLMTYSKNGKPHFIVVNPAGSVEKFRFDQLDNGFKVRTTEGKNELIDFLPFPANFGFIPSTHSEGIDKGDLLYGFLISPSYSIQTMIDVIPIGALSVIQDGKENDIVFCIPDNKDERIKIAETNQVPYEMRSTFEMWLTNGFGIDSILDWHDSKYADELIKTRSNR